VWNSRLRGRTRRKPATGSAELHARLARAQRRIDLAWYAALVAAALSLVLVAFGASSNLGEEISLAHRIAAADALFVLALAFGVSRRSRVAAGLLLAHLVVIQGGALLLSPRVVPAVVVLAFAWVYAAGFCGTVEYHRLIRAEAVR